MAINKNPERPTQDHAEGQAVGAEPREPERDSAETQADTVVLPPPARAASATADVDNVLRAEPAPTEEESYTAPPSSPGGDLLDGPTDIGSLAVLRNELLGQAQTEQREGVPSTLPRHPPELLGQVVDDAGYTQADRRTADRALNAEATEAEADDTPCCGNCFFGSTDGASGARVHVPVRENMPKLGVSVLCRFNPVPEVKRRDDWCGQHPGSAPFIEELKSDAKKRKKGDR